MIIVTRLNGNEMCINADLIERVESTPDTVLTLLDGRKYVAVEDMDEIIRRVIDFRASILVAAEARYGGSGTTGDPWRPHVQDPGRPLRLIQHDQRED